MPSEKQIPMTFRPMTFRRMTLKNAPGSTALNSTDYCDAVLRRVLMTAGATLLVAACSSSPDRALLPPPSTTAEADAAIASKPDNFPDLAAIPERPVTSTPEEREEVAESLIADKSRAQYTATTLRGGTEAPAAPPSATPPPPLPKLAESMAGDDSGTSMSSRSPASSDTDAFASNSSSEVQSERLASLDEPAAPPRSAIPEAASVGDENAEQPAASSSIPLLAPQSSAPRTATAAAGPRESLPPLPVPDYTPRARSTLPSTYANTTGTLPSAGARERIASLNEIRGTEPTFKTSHARPLPSTAGAVLSPDVVAHYNATVQNQRPGYYAPNYGTRTPTQLSSYSAPRAPAFAPPTNITSSNMGGPYVPVVVGSPANSYGAYSAATPANLPATPRPGTAVYPEAAGEPFRLFFQNGSNRLTQDQLGALDAVAAHVRAGGRLRIVGHSSSRTADMPVEEHLRINLESSQARANAVVAALINRGVDPDMLIIEAKGDAEPIYFEAMPAGEAGNRRVEIFLQ